MYGNIPMRCQKQANGGQCIGYEGHADACISQAASDQQRQTNLHPTLDDIRRVVREELQAILGKTRP